MGRGGTRVGGDHGDEIKDDGESENNNNKAAWLLGVKNLQIQPYHLPPLGSIDLLHLLIHPSTYCFSSNNFIPFFFLKIKVLQFSCMNNRPGLHTV